MKSIKSSEYNSADNYDYPEFIAVSGKDDRTPDEGFDNLEEAKVRADKIGGFVYQMINGEGVEIYSANESTTETTESEKATEIKEEYSEYAYKEYLNGMLDENGELLVFGRHFRGADDLEENDNPAFREGYNQWLDDLERDGTNTGVNESKASEKDTDDYEVDVDEYIKTGEPVEKLPKDKRSYNVELKATEDFGQFTIQNPNLITDGYPTDEEGFARASWDDAEIEDRKKWLIRAGFPDNAEEDAYLPYYSLQTMIRAVLSQDLHVGSIKAMAESKATEGSIEWTEVDERGLKVIDTGSTYKTEDGDTIIWSSFDADQAQRRLNQIVSNQSNKSSELAPTIEDMKYDDEPMRFGDGRGILGDPLYPESTKKEEEPKLDTEEEIDEFIKKEADEIVGALAVNDELEGIKDTYGSSPNADPTTTPLEDHSGTDDSSDTQLDTVDAQQETSDVVEDTVEESFGDCGCKDTKKARTTWESAIEGDKQYWLRNMGEDEGYSYYHFEHLPKRVGESLVNKFKVEESEDRGWSKIPALERANLLKKLGFPPRDAELVANLEYPQLSESLKKDVNDAVGVKKKAEESKREKPDGQLAFENDLYSNMYDGYLQRRGQRVDSKKNNKF